MNKHNIILLLLIILLSSSKSIADSQEDSQYLQQESTLNFDKMTAYEREIQLLNKRIEELEHNFKEINQKIKEINTPVAPKTDTNQYIDNKNTQIDKKTSLEHIKQQYNLALSTLKDGKYEQAEKMFTNFIKNYGNSDLKNNASFWYAETLYRQKKFELAAISYLKCYQTFPQGNKAADSLLKLALTLVEIQKTQKACEIINKLEQEFPVRSTLSMERAQKFKKKYNCKLQIISK